MADDAADRILVVLVGLLLDTVASIWVGRLLAAAVVDKGRNQPPVDLDCRMRRSSLMAAERRFERLADHTFDRRPAADNCPEVKRPAEDNCPELVDVAAFRDDTLVVHRKHLVDNLAVHRTVAWHQDSSLADRLGLRSIE